MVANQDSRGGFELAREKGEERDRLASDVELASKQTYRVDEALVDTKSNLTGAGLV